MLGLADERPGGGFEQVDQVNGPGFDGVEALEEGYGGGTETPAELTADGGAEEGAEERRVQDGGGGGVAVQR